MGIRGGASTLFFPLWHYEFEDLIVLKNNKGVDDARARKVDYCFQFNGFMYQRLLENGVISFFSPHEVPELYDAFCQDQEKFAKLYVKYEKDPKIRKRQMPAREVFTIFSTERFETGRIYLQNIDHSNTHSPFITSKAPIEQSNLCLSGDTLVDIKVNDEFIRTTLEDLNNKFHNEYKGIDVFVKSFNLESNKIEYNKVTNSALMNKSAKVMKITSDSGKEIICTPLHKFFTKNRGWVMAKDLKETDILVEDK